MSEPSVTQAIPGARDQPPSGGAGDGVAGRRGALVAVIGIAALHLVLQLVLMDPDRYVRNDEAVYISQVSQEVETIDFLPHRTRGIVVLIAPVTLLGGGVLAVRVWLAVVTAGLLGWAFARWVRLIGWGAVAGAALLATSWLAIFHGGEVLPHAPHALLGVAAVSFLHGRDPARRVRDTAIAAALLALVVTFRILDGLALALGMTASLAFGGARLKRGALLAAGAAAGALPWLVENLVRFGTEGTRYSADHIRADSIWVVEYLRGVVDPGAPAIAVAATWAGLGALAVVAVVAWRRTGAGPAVLVASASLAMLAFPYLFLVGIARLRYFVPAFALVLLLAGAGLGTLAGRARRSQVAIVALTLVALPVWGVWQADALAEQRRISDGQRRRAEANARFVADLAGGRPCLLAMSSDLRQQRQVSFLSGCRPVTLDPGAAAAIEEARRSGHLVFVATPGSQPGPPYDQWPASRFHSTEQTVMVVYRPPEQAT